MMTDDTTMTPPVTPAAEPEPTEEAAPVLTPTLSEGEGATEEAAA